MKRPKMILFDYGQTLVDEQKFDGIKGTEAVLQYATKNKYHKTAKEVEDYAVEILKDLGRMNPVTRHQLKTELYNPMFNSYLYASQGIELSIDTEEIDRVFWNAAAPGKPTDGIGDFLQYLNVQQIRTGVISNISYSPKVVKERIHSCLPDHEFEFILPTSEYLFRKPSVHIFELALEIAELKAEDVWYIGDQYECDVVGSRNAGMYPVWYLGAVDMEQEDRDDVLKVNSWSELKKLIGQLAD